MNEVPYTEILDKLKELGIELSGPTFDALVTLAAAEGSVGVTLSFIASGIVLFAFAFCCAVFAFGWARDHEDIAMTGIFCGFVALVLFLFSLIFLMDSAMWVKYLTPEAGATRMILDTLK